jgi:hypothetical protein
VHHKERIEAEMKLSSFQLEKKFVELTGIEPVLSRQVLSTVSV